MSIYQQLMASPKVLKPLRLMTHFACADEPDNPATQRQLALFQELSQGCEAELSIANSAGDPGVAAKSRRLDPAWAGSVWGLANGGRSFRPASA